MSYVANKNRYDSMPYARCGKSGLMLPKISLGLWHNFGEVDLYKTARDMILHSFDLGITHFDLANNYGPPAGSAEENFGKIFKQDLYNHRDEIIVSTKAGYKMWDGPYGEWGSRKNLLASLDQSLKRMGLDYVDIFYSHRPDPNTPLEETMQALDTAVRQGKALYVGVSSYNAEMTKRASKILKELRTPCLIHQPMYNITNRWVEDGLLKLLDEEGIGCIAFSVMAQGLLTDKYLNGIPNNSRAARPTGFLQKDEITEEKLLVVKKLGEIAKKRNQSIAQLAISWVLRRKEITSVLIGASSISQIDDSLGSLNNLNFTKDEFNEIDKIVNDNQKN